MAFTRKFDDRCAARVRDAESKNIFSYVMDPTKHYNGNPCFLERIPAGNTTSLTTENIVDMESELSGRTRAASKCPSGKYLPGTLIQGKGIKNRACGAKGKYGLPCGDMNPDGLVHLPRCSMVDYPARPTGVGYSLNYPAATPGNRVKAKLSSVRANLFVPIEYQGTQARY